MRSKVQNGPRPPAPHEAGPHDRRRSLPPPCTSCFAHGPVPALSGPIRNSRLSGGFADDHASARVRRRRLTGDDMVRNTSIVVATAAGLVFSSTVPIGAQAPITAWTTSAGCAAPRGSPCRRTAAGWPTPVSTPGADADLWLVDSGGGEASRVTRDAGVQSVAGWSPAGDALAYVAPDGERTALWMVRPRGPSQSTL